MRQTIFLTLSYSVAKNSTDTQYTKRIAHPLIISGIAVARAKLRLF